MEPRPTPTKEDVKMYFAALRTQITNASGPKSLPDTTTPPPPPPPVFLSALKRPSSQAWDGFGELAVSGGESETDLMALVNAH